MYPSFKDLNVARTHPLLHATFKVDKFGVLVFEGAHLLFLLLMNFSTT